MSEHEPGLGSTPDNLAQITAALDRLQESFDEKIRYDEVRERQITALHEELEAHRRNLYQQILQPVLTDLIGIHDEITKLIADVLPSGEPEPQAIADGLAFLLESVDEALTRNGVTSFSCEDTSIDRSRQKVIDTAPTDREDLDKQIARRVRPGFEVGGRVLRPEWIISYRYKYDAEQRQAETTSA